MDRPSVDSEEIQPGIVLDFDENQNLVGIDIDRASKLVDLSQIEIIRFLQHFSPGQGDYTQERHNRPTPDLDTLFQQMQTLPPPDPNQYDEIITP